MDISLKITVFWITKTDKSARRPGVDLPRLFLHARVDALNHIQGNLVPEGDPKDHMLVDDRRNAALHCKRIVRKHR